MPRKHRSTQNAAKDRASLFRREQEEKFLDNVQSGTTC
jgi:hypothetical protein